MIAIIKSAIFIAGLTFSILCSAADPNITQSSNADSTTFFKNLSIQKTWFKPYILENNHPICNSLLKDTQDKFISDNSYSKAYFGQNISIKSLEIVNILSFEKAPKIENFDNLYKFSLNDKPIYLENIRIPGCGGGCEARQLAAYTADSLQKSATNTRNAYPSIVAPGDISIIFAKDNKGDYFQIGFNSIWQVEELHAYQLKPDATWNLSCRIALAPIKQDNLIGTEIKSVSSSNKIKPISKSATEAFNSVNQLYETLSDISQGYGDCGSLRSGSTRLRNMRAALNHLVYRPWAEYYDLWNTRTKEDVMKLYDSNFKEIQSWSNLGVSEKKAFFSLQEQLKKTTEEITSFNKSNFGLNKEQAKRLAEFSIKSAINYGFGFGHGFENGNYNADVTHGENEQLKEAILNKAPIEDIRKLSFDSNASEENILNTSIEYPEALNYLLQKGADPNFDNAFGKTPLMYAAQFNQIESAKLLLQHDADPNAVTRRPENSCYYTLSRTNMTALHYAARYASPEFIKLLIESGAEPFIKAQDDNYGELNNTTPLDWFHYYTKPDGKERNPNISNSQLKVVEDLLKTPDADNLNQQANSLILQAEADYKTGKLDESYKALHKILNIQPNNERALSNMSLVSLKREETSEETKIVKQKIEQLGSDDYSEKWRISSAHPLFGESIEASHKLIKQSIDDKIKAKAWFNLGLACETRKAIFNQDSSFLYNGKYYCNIDTQNIFLKSYISDMTDSRAQKLIDGFKNGCQITYNNRQIHIYFSGGYNPDSDKWKYLQRVFIMHDKDNKISTNEFNQQFEFYDNGRSSPIVKNETPKLIGTYDVKTASITVLEFDNQLQFPFIIGSNKCEKQYQ